MWRSLAVVSLSLGALWAPAALAGPRHLIGHSVRGRPIYAYEIGDPGGRPVLVVGCIHGSEPAGIAIATALRKLPPQRGVDLWVIPVLNLDGRAAHTRVNADGVDLNRNFPYRWRYARAVPAYDSGPRALSEPESRAAYRFILRLRPAVSIWFHQHLGVVDDSVGSVALERRFARLVGLPLARLPDYHGSATAWEDHVLPNSTAFVVELHAGALTPAQVRRYAAAVRTIAR